MLWRHGACALSMMLLMGPQHHGIAWGCEVDLPHDESLFVKSCDSSRMIGSTSGRAAASPAHTKRSTMSYKGMGTLTNCLLHRSHVQYTSVCIIHKKNRRVITHTALRRRSSRRGAVLSNELSNDACESRPINSGWCHLQVHCPPYFR